MSMICEIMNIFWKYCCSNCLGFWIRIPAWRLFRHAGIFCFHEYRINSITLSLGIFHRFPILNPWIVPPWMRESIVFFPTFNNSWHSRNVIISGMFSYMIWFSFRQKSDCLGFASALSV